MNPITGTKCCTLLNVLILAKKRFTDGLDNLLGSSQEAVSRQAHSLFPDEPTEGTSNRDDDKKSKGFAAQLDAFLAEALEASESSDANKPRLTGLDLLIQRTKEPPMQVRQKVSDTRRLTLAFNKEQLAQLKKMAEQEGILLRDLINRLIDRYLQEIQ